MDHACGALEHYTTLMTYSRSSTVVHVLEALALRHPVHVLCGEARPMLEGQALARELSAAGMKVSVGVDMALFGWLDDVQVLLLGADTVAPSGLVNKLGTAPLAQAASRAGIPRVAIATTDKFVPREYPLRACRWEGDAAEIMESTNSLLEVRNSYFDLTPLDLLSLVITEEGAWSPSGLGKKLARIRIHPSLLTEGKP